MHNWEEFIFNWSIRDINLLLFRLSARKKCRSWEIRLGRNRGSWLIFDLIWRISSIRLRVQLILLVCWRDRLISIKRDWNLKGFSLIMLGGIEDRSRGCFRIKLIDWMKSWRKNQHLLHNQQLHLVSLILRIKCQKCIVCWLKSRENLMLFVMNSNRNYK